MSSEREIIRKLRESRRNSLMEGLHAEQRKKDGRLDEARRSPLEIFFAQLDGTIDRLVNVADKYCERGIQRDALDTYFINHLKFIQNNKDGITAIINTPAGSPSGIDIQDYLVEAQADYNPTGYKMFLRELSELMSRAKALDNKFNDVEQNREFDLLVMSRLEYIDDNRRSIGMIFGADSRMSIQSELDILERDLKKARFTKRIDNVSPTTTVSNDVDPDTVLETLAQLSNARDVKIFPNFDFEVPKPMVATEITPSGIPAFKTGDTIMSFRFVKGKPYIVIFGKEMQYWYHEGIFYAIKVSDFNVGDALTGRRSLTPEEKVKKATGYDVGEKITHIDNPSVPYRVVEYEEHSGWLMTKDPKGKSKGFKLFEVRKRKPEDDL